jgi:hypothetical protein
MSTVMTPNEIAAGISRGFARFIENEMRRQRGMPRDYIYASSWRACTRQMALDMLSPDKLPEFSVDTLANFRRGKDRERDLLADLTRAGRDSEPSFEVVGREERFELRDHKGRIAIVGKVDARLEMGERSAPLEVKSWHPRLVARIEVFDDLFLNRWTRAGAHQILAYLLASHEPFGFLALDRNGLPLVLEVELEQHLDRMEDFLARAELALDAKEKVLAKQDSQYLPAFIQDAAECKYCGFYGSICNPPSFTEGAELVVDESIIQKIERWHEVRDASQEYEALDRDIKQRFRGIEMAVAGGFLLEGKFGKSTRYDIPDQIKKKYASVDPKGRFTLSITKI